jgi:hypothetical protein
LGVLIGVLMEVSLRMYKSGRSISSALKPGFRSVNV